MSTIIHVDVSSPTTYDIGTVYNHHVNQKSSSSTVSTISISISTHQDLQWAGVAISNHAQALCDNFSAAKEDFEDGGRASASLFTNLSFDSFGRSYPCLKIVDLRE